MARVGFYTHPDYLKHDTGFGHPEGRAQAGASGANNHHIIGVLDNFVATSTH